MSHDILIIGAGPAGLMAAIAAARAGRRVLVLEKEAQPGRKLLASGGGRCNLANTLPVPEFMIQFGRQGRFMDPALRALDAHHLREFLAGAGVPTHAPDGFHVYPTVEKAQVVLDALLRLGAQAGVELRCGTEAPALWIEAGQLRGVQCGETRLAARQVIVAAGGKSYPALGGTESGYRLAEQAGHGIVPPLPALVGLLTRETWPHALAGISLPEARIVVQCPGFPRTGTAGAVLFTHRGISGPGILDLSGAVAAQLAQGGGVALRIQPLAQRAFGQWQAELAAWAGQHGSTKVTNLIRRHLPDALGTALVRQAGLADDVRAAHLRVAQRDSLANWLAGFPLTIAHTEGFTHAMVTRGGVRLKEVDPHTLQSRLLPGLFFAGEVLDLDGPSGGFNLQWAFSSGWLAGQAAGTAEGPRVSGTER